MAWSCQGCAIPIVCSYRPPAYAGFGVPELRTVTSQSESSVLPAFRTAIGSLRLVRKYTLFPAGMNDAIIPSRSILDRVSWSLFGVMRRFLAMRTSVMPPLHSIIMRIIWQLLPPYTDPMSSMPGRITVTLPAEKWIRGISYDLLYDCTIPGMPFIVMFLKPISMRIFTRAGLRFLLP